ncbi:MAG: permease-like cell division protein FtsX [Romboutsia sp.]
MKLMSKFLYSIKQGIRGIFSNKTMSFLSVISVSAVLIILGIVLTIVLNVNQFIKVTEDEINEIRLSMETNLVQEEKEILKEEIGKIKGIKNVVYMSKEESFNTMKESWGEDSYLLEGVENPLDDFFVVTIDNPDEIKIISSKLLTLKGAKDVEYYQDIMENFLKISNTVKKFGGILILSLLLICLVIISNTIKSRVHIKKEEIQIIKYVGASNLFVVAPFIVEGFIIGIVGSLLAVGVCVSMYGYILEALNAVISSMIGNFVVPLTSISSSLILVLVLTGIIVGVLGSIVSVKKYLKV